MMMNSSRNTGTNGSGAEQKCTGIRARLFRASRKLWLPDSCLLRHPRAIHQDCRIAKSSCAEAESFRQLIHEFLSLKTTVAACRGLGAQDLPALGRRTLPVVRDHPSPLARG